LESCVGLFAFEPEPLPVLEARVVGTAPKDSRKLAIRSLAIGLRDGAPWEAVSYRDKTALMTEDAVWLLLLEEPNGFAPLYSRKLAIACLPK
jgi:hypothetical protein